MSAEIAGQTSTEKLTEGHTATSKHNCESTAGGSAPARSQNLASHCRANQNRELKNAMISPCRK
jgi:hypothetical protein